MKKVVLLITMLICILLQSCYIYKLDPISHHKSSYGGLDVIYLKAPTCMNRHETKFGEGVGLVTSALGAVSLGGVLWGGLSLSSLIGTAPVLLYAIVNSGGSVRNIKNDKPVEKWKERYNKENYTDYDLYTINKDTKEYILLPKNAKDKFTASDTEELDFYLSHLKTDDSFNNFVKKIY